MPSLDFVVDLTDKIKSQGISYVVITVQQGKETEKVNTFYHIPNKNALDTLQKMLDTLQERLTKERKKHDK
jgi:hypothetical protein